MSAELKDAADRERIRQDTASTLFVEAGAGSGKTTALVDRVTTLALEDKIPVSAIAAVTFTEKAGAELRDKLRAKFEEVWRDRADPRHQLAEDALADLDAAAIGTLHAFAQRILSEHPIEAGIPPLLEVLDEVGSSVAFEERWAGLQTELLDDDAIAEPLLLGMAVGVTLKHVRSLAVSLGSDWDLIEERVLSASEDAVIAPDLTMLVKEAQRLGALADQCTDDTDRLLPTLAKVAEFAVRITDAPDEVSRLTLLKGLSKIKCSGGQKPHWPIVPVADIREDCKTLAADAAAVIAEVLDACLRRLTRWVAQRVLDAAQVRRSEGRLEFHDLLVLARDLLRRNESVREALHNRYQRLLLDEFQDTDPIQIELAVRIAGGASASAKRWQDVVVPNGRLFVVGDPKQSIYRFRRASIATYLEAQDHIGEAVSLTTNFRTVEPILDWVNEVFGKLIKFEKDSQPHYQGLDPYRFETGTGPAVTLLGAEPHGGLPRAQAAILREREARDVAAVIRQAIEEKWQVFDEQTKQWRDGVLGDIAVLVPARTSLPFLEDALDGAQVAYRAEASSLVYQASEVRDLFACARAVADTSDSLSVVTTLRSPLFGCGDDDLWRWKQAGGSFTIFSHLDEAVPVSDGPVGKALEYLRKLHNESRWMTPSEVLGVIVAQRRMLEVAATGPRERDSWRRLRFVVDQARAWSEASQGGLRAYLAWAAYQGQETSRVAEAVLPETDMDAVRVMTVHAAKGLEFPIVILSGMTSKPGNGSGVRLLWPRDGGYSVKLASGIQTGDFDTVQPIDEQMDSLERLRLMYVAATRARDHLVVSLHRALGSSVDSNALRFANAGAVSAGSALSFEGYVASAPSASSIKTTTPPPDYAVWLAGVEASRARSRAVAAISASGLEGTEPEVVLAEQVSAGLAKGARDVELPPWSKGRYGSEIGRAVHAVLQVVDLASGSGAEEAIASQCLAEGVVGQEDLVRSLVQSALSSDVVKRAAAREHWRETYVGTAQDDGTVLEGFVDLIYREDDGSLVVVDYKTDAVPAEGIPSRVTYYAPQMNAYVKALSDATGLTMTSTLLFLHPVGNAAVATNA